MAKKKLLLAALIVGFLAALLMGLYAKQQHNKSEELLGFQVEVVKSTVPIAANTPLTPELIKTELVPEKFLPPNPIRKENMDIYIGQQLAVPVAAGAMVLTSDFVIEKVSRDLSGKVPAGERAMSIPVDAISGVSGLLTPGDRVDILGTFPVSDKSELVPGSNGQDSVGFVTMTLLQNVTLLAVGQQLSNVGQAQSKQTYNSLTMSVTIEEAELLTIAQTRGKLMMLLRNRDDVEVAAIQRKTLKEVLRDLELINESRVVRIKKVTKRVRKKKDTGISITSGDKN